MSVNVDWNEVQIYCQSPSLGPQFPHDPVVRCRCRERREWLRAVALPAEAMNSAEDEVEGVGFRTDSCINGREGRVSRESCRNP